jgi:hypothetical protein
MQLSRSAAGRRAVVFGAAWVSLSPAMGLLPTARAQSASHSYAISFSPLARAGALGFEAQDLSEAMNDPADPGADLQKVVNRALSAFAHSRGRAAASDLDKAVAVADWVAATLRHPAFHPEDPGLPRVYPDTPSPRYETLGHEPVRIVNHTLSFDPDDAANWPSPQCTQQNIVVAGMLNVLGLHARLVDVEGHTGLEFYSFSHHKWIWVDATYNEHYVLPDGTPLGVRDLNRLTLHGGIESVVPVKHGYPTAAFRSNTYLWARPHGFRQYAVTLYMRIFGGKGWQLSRFDTVVYSPTPPASYRPLPGEILNFDRDPQSGGWYRWPRTVDPESLDYPLDRVAIFDGVTPTAAGVVFTLRSYLPYTARFQIRYGDPAQPWSTTEAVPSPSSRPVLSAPVTVPWGNGTVSVRAVDNVRNVTLPLVLDLTP